MSSLRNSRSFAAVTPSAHSSVSEWAAMEQLGPRLRGIGEGSWNHDGSGSEEEPAAYVRALVGSPRNPIGAVRMPEAVGAPIAYSPTSEWAAAHQIASHVEHTASAARRSSRSSTDVSANAQVVHTAPAARPSITISSTDFSSDSGRSSFFFPVLHGETVVASVRGVVAFCARGEHHARLGHITASDGVGDVSGVHADGASGVGARSKI